MSGFPVQCVNAAAGGATNSSLPAADNPYGELATLGCYLENGTAISPAGQGTYGDMPRNVLRGQPFKETDLSITKSWRFRERLTAQYRAEFFNIFNSVEYATPYLTTNSNLASPANFGRSLSTPNTFSFIFGSGGPRTMQMALKLISSHAAGLGVVAALALGGRQYGPDAGPARSIFRAGRIELAAIE